MNTQIDDELISRFMGSAYGIPYSSEWKHIMDVVEKIESLPDYYMSIEEKSCYVYDVSTFNDEFCDSFIQVDKETKFSAVYEACVLFIKWYNKKEN